MSEDHSQIPSCIVNNGRQANKSARMQIWNLWQKYCIVSITNKMNQLNTHKDVWRACWSFSPSSFACSYGPHTLQVETKINKNQHHDFCNKQGYQGHQQHLAFQPFLLFDIWSTVGCKINCSAVFERFLKCAILTSFGANCTLIIPDLVMTWLIWWLI